MDETTQPADRPTLTTAERQAILAEYDSYPRGDPRRGALPASTACTPPSSRSGASA